VLDALAGIRVSTGFIAGVRGRAAALLDTAFLPRLRALLATAGVLHADETTGQAAGAHRCSSNTTNGWKIAKGLLGLVCGDTLAPGANYEKSPISQVANRFERFFLPIGRS
jgi:Transposase IS66 family